MPPAYIQYIRTPEETFYTDPLGRFTLSHSLHQVDGVFRCMVHFWVSKQTFKPSTLREMQRVVADLRPRLPKMIGCHSGPGDNPTFHHFVSKFGFQAISPIPWDDGKVRTLYIHIRP